MFRELEVEQEKQRKDPGREIVVPGPFVGQADTCPREFYKAEKNGLVRYPLAHR